jgi:hypothetical protein
VLKLRCSDALFMPRDPTTVAIQRYLDALPGDTAARDDSKLAPADRTRLQGQYADRAMEFLHRAVVNGFENAAAYNKDPDLAPLRSREDFQKLVREIEQKSKQ